MRFRAELLQPPSGDSELALTKIYDVYRTPAGHIEGQDEDIVEVLEQDSAGLPKLGVGASKTRPGNVPAFIQEFKAQTPTERCGLRLWQDQIGFLLRETFEPNTVHIMVVWSFTREQGWGSKAMKWLCDLADKHGITLKLEAEPMLTEKPNEPSAAGLHKKDLRTWYGRFGFNRSSGKGMIRQPIEPRFSPDSQP